MEITVLNLYYTTMNIILAIVAIVLSSMLFGMFFSAAAKIKDGIDYLNRKCFTIIY